MSHISSQSSQKNVVLDIRVSTNCHEQHNGDSSSVGKIIFVCCCGNCNASAHSHLKNHHVHSHSDSENGMHNHDSSRSSSGQNRRKVNSKSRIPRMKERRDSAPLLTNKQENRSRDKRTPSSSPIGDRHSADERRKSNSSDEDYDSLKRNGIGRNHVDDEIERKFLQTEVSALTDASAINANQGSPTKPPRKKKGRSRTKIRLGREPQMMASPKMTGFLPNINNNSARSASSTDLVNAPDKGSDKSRNRAKLPRANSDTNVSKRSKSKRRKHFEHMHTPTDRLYSRRGIQCEICSTGSISKTGSY